MEFLKILPFWYIALTFSILGAAIGSFLNVVIYRFPKNLSIVKPSSHCPQCKRPIKPWNNIPIISYLILGGKCPNCKSRISIRYPIVELMGLLAALLPLLRFGVSIEAFAGMVLGWHLIVIAFVDADEHIIPDHFVLPLFITGIGFSFLKSGFPGLLTMLGSVALAGGFFGIIWLISKFILRKDGLGSGDITLSVAFSAYLLPIEVFVALFVGAVAGIIGSASLSLLTRTSLKNRELAYGPYLSIGALISYYYGNDMIGTYLNFVLG